MSRDQVELPPGRCGRPSRGTREVEGAGAPIREKHSKTTATLDEDIKTAALEALVPSELEQHRAMNRARLLTVRSGSRRKFRPTFEAHRSRRGQPEGGKGKPNIGTGQGAVSLEQGDRAAAAEQQP